MQTFQKPENALKRANELLSIGQQDAALRILHTAIGHRRFRSQGWDAVQEAIMMRHVQLCVDEGKLRLARDGLHQYRIISQHANVQSLGKVVAELRTRSEAKLAAAKAKAGDDELKLEGAAPEDLDMEADTPENLLLSTLQIEVRSPEARDVHQALRAEWDVYKMILDLLRTTPKLERVYHETARRAFAFCRDNKRPQEFKRLCDVLRSHFALILKNRGKDEYESLLRPDMHLETRMQQLSVASDLELWRECSATAEDIYALGLHDYFHRSLRSGAELFHKSREKLLRWMALYYEKMSRVMWVGENYLFHALAWVKFFLHVKGFKKNATPEYLQSVASVAVLAVLEIPNDATDKRQAAAATDAQAQPNYEQQKRMAQLLGHATVPTRASLTAVLKSKDILSLAEPTCQELFSLLEAEFTPLKLCSLCQPLLEQLDQNPLLQPYVPALKRVVFQKLTQQLAEVYVLLSIDYFTSHICTADFLPWSEAEKLLVSRVLQQRRGAAGGSGGSAGGLSVRIDYSARALIFETAESCAEQNIRSQVLTLAKSLDWAVQKIQPAEDEEHRSERLALAESVTARLQAETARMNERMRRTNLRRLEKQEEQQRLEEERRRKEAEQRRVEELQERERREEASKRRVERRQQEERIKARSETAALMLDEIRRIGGKDSKILIKGKQLTDINIEDVLEGNVDYDDLEKAQRLQLNKERLMRLRQRRANFKRVCHFVRACREEELPLLEAWCKKQLEQDTAILVALHAKHEEENRAAFAAALEEKSVFELVREDKDLWVKERMAERCAEFARAAQQQRERLVGMLKTQKLQRAKERRDEAQKQARAEAETRKREEEQKRYLEEIERQKAEQEAKAKKLAEMAEKQRQREREIEEKMMNSAREAPVRRAADAPPPSRRAEAASAAAEETLEWRRSAAAPLPSAETPERAPPVRRERPVPQDDDLAQWRSAPQQPRQPHAPQRQPQVAAAQQKPQPTKEEETTQEEAPHVDDGFTRVQRRK